jgi:hypothetical protein
MQRNIEFTTPEQLGALAIFLYSDAAAQLSGVALPVDGGWLGTMTCPEQLAQRDNSSQCNKRSHKSYLSRSRGSSHVGWRAAKFC